MASEVEITMSSPPAKLPSSFDFSTPEAPAAGQWVSDDFSYDKGSPIWLILRLLITFGTANFIEYAIERSGDEGVTWTQVYEEVYNSSTVPPDAPDRLVPFRRRIYESDCQVDGSGNYRVYLPDLIMPATDKIQLRLRLRADVVSQANCSAAYVIGGLL